VSGQTSLPGDSEVNDINAHVLRLGFSAQAELGNFIDLSAEVAAVPYAKVTGTLGAGSGFAMTHAVEYDNATGFGPTGPTGAVNVHNIQSSPTTIDGWGYGAMAQAFVGFRPADNVVFRLGGRAWYLQGTADAMFSRANIGPGRCRRPQPAEFRHGADLRQWQLHHARQPVLDDALRPARGADLQVLTPASRRVSRLPSWGVSG
jgi:hypothetical protein